MPATSPDTPVNTRLSFLILILLLSFFLFFSSGNLNDNLFLPKRKTRAEGN